MRLDGKVVIVTGALPVWEEKWYAGSHRKGQRLSQLPAEPRSVRS